MLEVCVDTLEGAIAAMKGGAVRVELCSSLSEGGLTPSAGLMQAASKLTIPCYAMIRPRCGLFHFSHDEVGIMLADIEMARQSGLAGVVVGAQHADGTLDMSVLAKLVEAAGPLGKTLHRVIDVVPDPLLAVDQAVLLGFDRVLTSGAQPTAPEGVEMIARMVKRANSQLSVMPGCGLTANNVAEVMTLTGASEAHAACNQPAHGDPAFSDFDPPGGRFETSENEVREMKQAMGTRAT
ncbi:copper homeostasis protein CutC [Aliiroseovarius sp. KMU-50]|uniref:PF03932 family protein CutC n=1 Tax=Aliiroseovarius salicola TaxID=3009082 RepID=A0ABT4W0R6_9RHOB|nr:copper homeostasis protein CutC [Aliiroseovarius sp. KMU-50]MDA5093363.1 copper homeostasis protein CutC [Aliiroseovarius sp. KMU-50]